MKLLLPLICLTQGYTIMQPVYELISKNIVATVSSQLKAISEENGWTALETVALEIEGMEVENITLLIRALPYEDLSDPNKEWTAAEVAGYISAYLPALDESAISAAYDDLVSNFAADSSDIATLHNSFTAMAATLGSAQELLNSEINMATLTSFSTDALNTFSDLMGLYSSSFDQAWVKYLYEGLYVTSLASEKFFTVLHAKNDYLDDFNYALDVTSFRLNTISNKYDNFDVCKIEEVGVWTYIFDVVELQNDVVQAEWREVVINLANFWNDMFLGIPLVEDYVTFNVEDFVTNYFDFHATGTSAVEGSLKELQALTLPFMTLINTQLKTTFNC